MKKSKSYILIILLTILLIFGTTTCQLCGPSKPVSTTVYKATTSTTKPDPNLIHGVLPKKVTGSNTDDKTNNEKNLEFWNVGKLGGEQYSKATYIISKDGKTIETYEGYFTGGPEGEFFLNSSTGKELHGKLEGGKSVVSESGGIATIDNPEAFDGWVD
jgi:hypothetical protein